MSAHLTVAQKGAALGLLGTGLLLWPSFLILISSSLSSYFVSPGPIINLLLVFLPLFLLLSINGLALVKQLPNWLVVLRSVLFWCIFLLCLIGFLMVLPFFCNASRCDLFTPSGFLFLLTNPFFESCLWGFFLNFLGLFIVYRRS